MRRQRLLNPYKRNFILFHNVYSLIIPAHFFVVSSAAAVGKCFAEILSLEKNGTIWLIDGGEYKEVVLTKYWLK